MNLTRKPSPILNSARLGPIILMAFIVIAFLAGCAINPDPLKNKCRAGLKKAGYEPAADGTIFHLPITPELIPYYRCRARGGVIDAEAQFRIAYAYEFGIGFEKNLKKAEKEYRKIVRSDSGIKFRGDIGIYHEPFPGHPGARYRLALLYLTQDDENKQYRARYWLRCATKQGHRGAMEKLDELGEDRSPERLEATKPC